MIVRVWANGKVVDESSVNEYVTVSPKSMATRLYKKSGHPKMLVGRNRHDLAPWSVTCSKDFLKMTYEMNFEMLNINIDATYPSAGSINPEVELRYAEIDFETGLVSNYKLVTALSKVFFRKLLVVNIFTKKIRLANTVGWIYRQLWLAWSIWNLGICCKSYPGQSSNSLYSARGLFKTRKFWNSVWFN